MDLSEFTIGGEFICSGRRYRCTDIGTRTVVAIQVDESTIGGIGPDGPLPTRTIPGAEADAMGLFNGPPYGVLEHLFDEDDREICEPA